MVNYYHQVRQNRLYWKELASYNLQSGMEIWLSDSPAQEPYTEQSLFESKVDSFIGVSEAWGLFTLKHGTGVHSGSRSSRSCLIGEAIPPNRDESLYLVDRRQPLVVVGNARLSGKLSLPPSGIKSGFIGRRGFENERLYTGRIVHSKRNMPPFPIQNRASIKHILDEIHSTPTQEQAFALEGVIVHQPWDKQAYEIISPGSIVIRQSSLKGKSRIIAAGSITIQADAQLDHSLLFARNIIIETGFRGRIQAIATRSILIEEDAQLTYPSVLMVSKKDQAAQLILKANTLIEGAVIFDSSISGAKADRNDYVQLASTSTVKGIVTADHSLEIQGTVLGQVVTGSFVLRTAGGMYRNHIIDAHINFNQLSEDYAAPLMYGGAFPQIIEWL